MTSAPGNPFALIADDEDLGRLLLAEAAEGIGFTPLVHDNGVSALKSALARDVGLVLLDVDMPMMDGYAVCRQLRQDPRFELVPIVMVTGHEDAAAVERAYAAGATDFVAKPVNWTLLPHRLDYIVRNASRVRALAAREVQVRTLVEAISDKLWVVTAAGAVTWRADGGASTPRAGAVTGLQDPLLDLVPASELRALRAAIQATTRDGVERTLACRVDEPHAPMVSYEFRLTRRGGGDVVVQRRDTTERTRAAAHIEHLAYFDTLTGLANRQQFLIAATRCLEDAVLEGDLLAVVYMDLNGFKRINDSFGHAVGDDILRLVSARLNATMQQFDRDGASISLARIGGDEFAALLRHRDARRLARLLCNEFLDALRKPIIHDGLEFYTTASVGVAVYPHDGADISTLIRNADTAMREAKASGAVTATPYSPAMNGRRENSLDLEARLRRAVRTEALHLVYQPKFRVRDGAIVGVEALVRWQEADHGDVSPAIFIPIAEESSLIIDIGTLVIRTACRQVRTWLDAGLCVPVAVNLSAKELLHGNPAALVEAEARAAGVPTSLLEIELTESMLAADSPNVRRALDHFRQLGCRIALDDFGTGYSSLSYLTRFPPDRIKIDKVFIRNVDVSIGDAAIANAILSIGQTLKLLVTAEGVERPAQLEWLRERRCDEIQGFLLSRPLRADEILQRYLNQLPAAKSGIEAALR